MKILPPALFLIFVVVMVMLRLVAPGWLLVPAPSHWLGLVPMVSGAVMAMAGSRHFGRVGTNIRTFDDPDILVTDGLFRWSRNPMYLGFALFLGGLAVVLQSLAGFVLAAVFIAITDRWYIRFEEEVMRRKFGADYAEYTRQTRRWL